MGSLEDKAKVGTVSDIVIDPDDGSVLGLIIKKNFFDISQYAVSWQDIRDIDKNGLVIGSKESILPIDEIVRIGNLQKEKFNIIGLPTVTSDNSNLGDVYDYEIDFKIGVLSKIFCRALLGKKRIISQSKIIRIDKDKIVVRSGALKVTATAQETREAIV